MKTRTPVLGRVWNSAPTTPYRAPPPVSTELRSGCPPASRLSPLLPALCVEWENSRAKRASLSGCPSLRF